MSNRQEARPKKATAVQAGHQQGNRGQGRRQARGIDYLALLRQAVQLGIAPEEFWRMTPREIAAVLQIGAQAISPPSRQTLQALMRRWPDAPKELQTFKAGACGSEEA